MEKITDKYNVRLDLSEWWKMVKDSVEAEKKILRWEEWPFYWFDESGYWVITLKDGKYTPYKISETKIIVPVNSGWVWLQSWKWSLNDRIYDMLKEYELHLKYQNEVEDSSEAYKRAEAWEKEMFWFYSEDKSIIRTLDFSKREKPLMMDYCVEKTKITYDTMQI